MAAALIALTSWHTDMPFVDPVCGSGTIPIEAAMIGRNLAPGYNRDFLCETWDWIPNELSRQVRAEADAQADYDTPLQIFGSDIDGHMIAIAKRNAEEAGLSQDITFKQLAVQDFTTELHHGVIVANPPYGERLSDQAGVRELYRQMGQVFKPLTDWSKYILTADLEFEHFYGQKATKKRKLYNGALRTDYFQFWAQRRPRTKAASQRD